MIDYSKQDIEDLIKEIMSIQTEIKQSNYISIIYQLFMAYVQQKNKK